MNLLDKICIDLKEFKIELHFQSRTIPLIVHFDTPARRFYFSLISLIIVEMKNKTKPEFIYIRKHEKRLKLLDRSLAGQYASNSTEAMWVKIRKAWRGRIPDLESAFVFKIINRDLVPPIEKGGKYRYECSEEECDVWASLFQFDENNKWRFKFAVDSASLDLDDIYLKFEELKDNDAWDEYIKQAAEKEKAIIDEKIKLEPRKTRLKYQLAIGILAMLLTIVTGTMVHNFYFNTSTFPTEHHLSDKPSIVVMPFINMSDDPDQEYFSDGITEDIITNLSKVSGLFIISRSSSFIYKGKNLKAQEVTKELGVRYMLEGSVRRSGDRLRITAQLIDGKTGNHMWADYYDRTIHDIFSVQDSVTQKVVSELAVTLKAPEVDRISRKHTKNFNAYDLYLRARKEGRTSLRKEGHLRSLELSQQIIEIDPNFAGGYQQMSYMLSRMVRFGYSSFPREDLEKSFELAQKAVSIDDTFALGYLALASANLMKGHHDEALANAKLNLRLEPGSADAHRWVAFYLNWAGQGEMAVKEIKKALQLDPKYLTSGEPGYLDFLGFASFTAGEYEESIWSMKKAIELYGPFPNRLAFIIASYSELGRNKEARAIANQLLKTNPKFALKSWRFARLYKNPEDTERLLNALRRAGLK